jgi:hypothetical protein
MPTISLTAGTAERLRLLSRAWSVTEDDAVSRLLDEFTGGQDEPTTKALNRAVSVHAIYEGERILGRFQPESGKVEIDSAPCAGRSFRTPSGAAIAVVQAMNPRVNPNRNGWSFWIVTDTGKTLQSLRSKR